jgi:hypothetical protein
MEVCGQPQAPATLPRGKNRGPPPPPEDGTQNQSGRFVEEKILLSLPELKSRMFQPVAYTD